MRAKGRSWPSPCGEASSMRLSWFVCPVFAKSVTRQGFEPSSPRLGRSLPAQAVRLIARVGAIRAVQQRYQLCAVADAEFCECIVQMGADGCELQIKPSRNLLVGKTLRREASDLGLSRR